MNFTLGSKPLIKVENLDLLFRLKLYGAASLRSQFIKILSAPIQSLNQKNQVLHVLKDINFSAYHGDRIALIGKNGAGKSTFCRCLTGIYQPSAGQIHVNGKVRSILDPSAVIYPELTGRENARVLMSLLYPEFGDTFEQHFDEALSFSGLGTFLDTPYRYYSTGMQTRLCLSIATCAPADIFVLDEVFEGADMEFSERISNRISNLIKNSGAVIFVSHSEEQMRKVCNKGLLIHHGRIMKFGPLSDVLNHYRELMSLTQQH